MADARIATTSMPFNKAQVTFTSAQTSYPSLVPTTTKPVTSMANGVVIYDAASTSAAWSVTPNTALIAAPSLFTLIPFSSINSGTFGMRVTKFNQYRNAADSATWWMPTTVFDGTLSIGSAPNFAPDGTTLYLFNAITSSGYAPTANMYSPGSVLASATINAAITLDPVGAQLISVQFISSGSVNGTSMGVFWTTT